MNQNWGRGQWRGRGCGGFRGGNAAGLGGRKFGGGRGRDGRASQSTGSVNFDPLACYRCGVHGHLARDCPQSGHAQSQGSGNAAPSRRGFSKSGHKGPRGRGRGRTVRFGGLNVLYDEAGNEYPVDDAGKLYAPLGYETEATEVMIEEEKQKETKN